MSLKESSGRLLILLLFILLNFGCDQITKEVARTRLNYGQQVNVVDEFVVLRLIENKGAFFGMGSEWESPARVLILLILPGLAILLMSLYLFIRRPFTWLFAIGCTAIIGGSAGNLIDRLVYQSVTDFLNLGIGSLRTGIFNFADVSIMLGVLLVLLDMLRPPK